jgi:putative membrane protein
MNTPAVDLHNALTQWSTGPFALVVLAALVVGAAWYLRAVRRLEAKGRRWPIGRTTAFIAGLASIELAFGSSVATFSMSDFSSHVIQHMLLMILAPPLLAMGAPSTLILQTSSARTKSAFLRGLHSPAFRILSHPLTVWCLYYGLMFVFFLSALLGFAMAHMALMDLLNVVFLAGGTLFWWPMISPDPIPSWRMGYAAKFVNLLVGVPFESFLGIALMSETSPAASIYSLSGTHAGGGVLWAVGELSIAVAMFPIFRQWIRSDDREARRADRRGQEWVGEDSGWAAEWTARTGRVPSLAPSSAEEDLGDTMEQRRVDGLQLSDGL